MLTPLPPLTTRLAGALLAVALLGTPGRAAATSCGDPVWDHSYSSPLRSETVTIPVDGQPWEYHYCNTDYFSPPSECELVGDSGTVPVDVEHVGASACNIDYLDLIDNTGQQYIVRYVPAAPLTPGEKYVLECKDGPRGELRVRNDATPSAPPPALAVADAHYSRDDDGCCGSGDTLQLQIDGLDDPAMREGGVVEAVYPNGQTFALAGLSEGRVELPPIDGTITLTPVAANGVRGETIEFAAGDVDGDLVYIPCKIAARTAPASLWMLAPFAWMFAHGRQRRRRAS